MTVSINERQLNYFLSMQWDKGIAYLKTRFDSLRYEEMEDVIIDSMTALAENVRNGKYQKGDADLGTYFIAICRNQALKRISGGNRPTFISLIDNRRTTSDDDVNLSDELDFNILSKEQYDSVILQEAIERTFANRHTSYDANNTFFNKEFSNNQQMQVRWQAFMRKITPKDEMSFPDIVSYLQEKLRPYWERLSR